MSEEAPQFGPPRDRRKRKRWLTKRNVLIGVATILALFFVLQVWSETRGGGSDGYGRLYSQRTRLPELPERRGYDVVLERGIEGKAGADPLLIEGMRREQILGVEPGMLEKQYGIATPEQPLEGGFGETPRLGTGDDAKIAITGGPDGVKVEPKDP